MSRFTAEEKKMSKKMLQSNTHKKSNDMDINLSLKFNQ